MAARKNLKHDEKVRQKIRDSQLVNVLIKDAKGEIELTTGRRKSIEILLKKAIPDLSAISIDGGVEHSLSPETLEWLGKS
jgi:hypothetical protein